MARSFRNGFIHNMHAFPRLYQLLVDRRLVGLPQRAQLTTVSGNFYTSNSFCFWLLHAMHFFQFDFCFYNTPLLCWKYLKRKDFFVKRDWRFEFRKDIQGDNVTKWNLEKNQECTWSSEAGYEFIPCQRHLNIEKFGKRTKNIQRTLTYHIFACLKEYV